jgi:DNA-binding response OmpR family regulator
VNVWIIEDDPGIASFLVKGMAAEGHRTIVIDDGSAAMAMAAAVDDSVDLVLLDLGLPNVDGIDVLRVIRTTSAAVPVIALTARDSVASTVLTLDAGANDYMTKPFSFEELLARIRAVVRDKGQRNSAELEVHDLRLDLLTKYAHRGNRRIELAPREWALLEFLMRHPSQVLSREQILSHVWGHDSDTSSNIVDVYVGYLRRKLNRDGERPLLATVRGAGYRMVPTTFDEIT